ncbi:MAG TPA: hypothetical protein VMF69_19175 [Gemmataceae bacterium]|nr:hypothetical protein [Gemmataceae bacterium]
MPDPDDVELVRKAILSRTTGDCEWSESAARRMQSDPSLSEWTPESILALLRDYVAQGGSIDRRTETRSEYPQDHWYRVVVPVKQFRHGLFVEIILVDEDPEAPAVQIVSVHEQRK